MCGKTKGFHVQLALPGWSTKDVSIQVEKAGYDSDRRLPVDDHDATWKVYQWEIPKGQFGIRYRLPDFVQQEQASANFRDGVLTISFPKREEAKASTNPD